VELECDLALGVGALLGRDNERPARPPGVLGVGQGLGELAPARPNDVAQRALGRADQLLCCIPKVDDRI
jgi:hypothetical protein